MFRLLSTAFLVFSTSVHAGDEPGKEQKPFEAPAPKAVPPSAPEVPAPRVAMPSTSDYLPYYLPSSLPRPGTREVWQYYGVDSRGRWVARVILSPTGAYYSHNGNPFLYTTTRPQVYMPYVVD